MISGRFAYMASMEMNGKRERFSTSANMIAGNVDTGQNSRVMKASARRSKNAVANAIKKKTMNGCGVSQERTKINGRGEPF